MKIFLQGLIAMLAAASTAGSFAADFDPTVNFGDITALSADSITSEINSAMAIAYAGSDGAYTQNTALIAQSGDGNYASIEQQGGSGNFVGIVQDASNGANFAIVGQNGSNNFVYFNQSTGSALVNIQTGSANRAFIGQR